MTTKDSQTKRLDSTIWMRANPHIETVMTALREKRGDTFALNAAGRAYDKFQWWHVRDGGDFFVPLAHYRSIKPTVAAQMRRMGFSASYIDRYLDYQGPCVVGANLRNVVEQRFWEALSAAIEVGEPGDEPQ